MPGVELIGAVADNSTPTFSTITTRRPAERRERLSRQFLNDKLGFSRLIPWFASLHPPIH